MSRVDDDVIVEEIDPKNASDEMLRARWEAGLAVTHELDPEEPDTPFEQWKLEQQSEVSFEKPRHLLAWNTDRSELLGYARLELTYTETNRHLAWFELGVPQGARRQKVGTRLLHDVVELARLDGRTVVGSFTVDGHDGDAFAEAFGFERKATERKSRLLVGDVDRELMQSWVANAEAHATDYEIISYEGRSPEELIDQFVDLYAVTNTAPRDDLDMEDEVMTRERYLEKEDRNEALGTNLWRVLVRHKPSGDLAGFTEFWFPKTQEEVVYQGWTAVRPDHRNHGIGRWLKAVNILRLIDEKPGVVAVDTWNAFSNGPMLGINIAMGFQLLRGYNDWQAKAERVVELTKERLGG